MIEGIVVRADGVAISAIRAANIETFTDVALQNGGASYAFVPVPTDCDARWLEQAASRIREWTPIA